MLDPRDLYELNEPVVDGLRARSQAREIGPVLVNFLKGFIDAGHMGELAVEHLLATGNPVRVATFDHDRLVDYHAKRPTMLFERTRWGRYDGPHIVLDLLEDADGANYLLLHGNEPDRYWDSFVAAVIGLINDFNVSLSVGMYGIPMGVPHTRPQGTVLHASREGLLDEVKDWMGSMTVPASVSNLIEYRLGESERDAIGVAVQVPHYLAQSQYAPAAIVGLTKVEGITGLSFATEDLVEDAREAVAEVDRQVENSAEVAEMVKGLENQYDAFVSAHPQESLLAQTTRIPTAEELGAEFEQFLSQQPGMPDAE